MALIMHLTRVPRYQNIYTDEYETLPFNDVLVINKYFDWKKHRANGGDCYSLQEWCGVAEKDMPHKYVVNYYGDFYTKKTAYNDYDGDVVEVESIFEDLARLVKMNQVLNWLVTNVTGGKIDKEYYEISEEQLTKLCGALKRTRHGITLDEDGYHVNEYDAKKYMPLMDNVESFWGPKSYNDAYAEQIAAAYDIIREILNTTDFKKESIYFNII